MNLVIWERFTLIIKVDKNAEYAFYKHVAVFKLSWQIFSLNLSQRPHSETNSLL